MGILLKEDSSLPLDTPAVPPGQKTRTHTLVSVFRHAILITVALAFTIPFYWMVISALKPNELV
ncbi:MAG TPA: hypothetical protein PK530_24660, partial [Anaerolineales bacterium]|nr:hypothetical protein [Anaerolineales bacterium]